MAVISGLVATIQQVSDHSGITAVLREHVDVTGLCRDLIKWSIQETKYNVSQLYTQLAYWMCVHNTVYEYMSTPYIALIHFSKWQTETLPSPQT